MKNLLKSRLIVICGYYGSGKTNIAVNLALTAATVLGADVLTSLYLPDRSGAAFALARSYFLLLIPNYFLQFGKTSLEAVCKAHLKIPLVTVSAMLSLAVRVALGYALAPSYGITALAWATNAGSAAALAACNSQTASPFGCLNNFYFRILSNFLGHFR